MPLFLDGLWRDAAMLDMKAPHKERHSQARLAYEFGISRRTLSDIEQDKKSASLTTLNRAFKPLGLKIGLLPRQNSMMQQLLNQLRHKEDGDDDS